MGCKYHHIVKSAGSQTSNKSSKHDNMTPEFCKKVYQMTYFKEFRLGILGKNKVLEKSQIGWRKMLVPVLPFRNNFLVIAVKNYTL